MTLSELVGMCGADSVCLRDASQFYASPAGEEGYDRFTNAWTTSTDADCANDVFNVSETDVFSSKPFINAAFAYDCTIALAAAMHSAGENASGAAVFEAFTNVSFEGATGEVAFDPNGERNSSTVRYAVDVWRASGSELTAIRVGSFTTKSGYTTSSSDSFTWPKDTYASADAVCSAKDYEYAQRLHHVCYSSPLVPSLSFSSGPRSLSHAPTLPPSQVLRIGLRGHAADRQVLLDRQQQLHHRPCTG